MGAREGETGAAPDGAADKDAPQPGATRPEAQSIVEERKEEEHVVQGPTRFSESIIWEQMRRFYSAQGVEAWAKGIVPFFITCNAFIANAYAKVVLAYLADLHRLGKLRCEAPVYLVELGVGSGKFSFLLLKALMERMELLYGDDAPFRIKYVMTDFCDTAFSFWAQHSALRRFINANVLDFAQFDACHDTVLRLERSKKQLTLGSLANPPIVIANYLFDSLPADAFRVRGGVLEEGLLSVLSRQTEPDPGDPAILSRFRAHFSYAPRSVEAAAAALAGEPGTEAVFEAMLRWYTERFAERDASFLVPSASLRCLDNLRRFSQDGRLMVLSGDKGLSNAIAFQQSAEADPHIAVHGSFSLMVNYHAIGLWFDANGGFALHCPLEDASLKVSCFVLDAAAEVPPSTARWNLYGDPDPARTRPFPRLRMAFRETMQGFGPDHFFHLQQHDWASAPTVSADTDTLAQPEPPHHQHQHQQGGQGGVVRETEPSVVAQHLSEERIKAVMAMLQLCDWDADLVFKFREVILDQLSVCNVRLLGDLRRGMERAWDNYFLLEPDKDFAFELGRFYYGLQEYERALVFYTKSSELIGKHHVTEHNIGLCHTSLGNQEQALRCFERSLEQNPNYRKAQEQRDLLRRKLRLPPARPTVLDLATCGDAVLRQDSPLNSPHVRVSFDPEVIHRSRSNSAAAAAAAATAKAPATAAPP